MNTFPNQSSSSSSISGMKNRILVLIIERILDCVLSVGGKIPRQFVLHSVLVNGLIIALCIPFEFYESILLLLPSHPISLLHFVLLHIILVVIISIFSCNLLALECYLSETKICFKYG